MINAFLLQQFLVAAFFDDFTMVHDHDHIRGCDRAQAMRNDEAGSSFLQSLQGILNEPLRLRINIAGCFIENQNARIGQ